MQRFFKTNGVQFSFQFCHLIWYKLCWLCFRTDQFVMIRVFYDIFSRIKRRRRILCVLDFLVLLIDTRVTWNLPPIPAIGKSHCTTSSEWNSMKSNTADNHDLQSSWDEEIQSLISITFYYGLFLVWSCFSDALQYICLLNTDFRISKLVLCFMSSWRNLSDKQNTLLPTLSTHMFL